MREGIPSSLSAWRVLTRTVFCVTCCSVCSPPLLLEPLFGSQGHGLLVGAISLKTFFEEVRSETP